MLSASVPFWETHLPRKTEELGSIPGTARHIVVLMTTSNDNPLSFHPIPSGRLEKTAKTNARHYTQSELEK